MKLVTLDFETAYDKSTYSISKMTTEEYVNDPRFEVIGVSAKIDNGPASWRTGDFEYIKDQLGGKGWWRDVGLVCHNTRFDASILAWKFGIVPKLYFDTLSMARPKHSANVGGSLKKLAEYYAHGEKGTEVLQASGKWRKDFTPDELARYGEYCKNDVELTYALFKSLFNGFPKDELRLINRTIRMYVEPQLGLDQDLIAQEIDNETARKDELMARLDGLDQKDLRSNPKFAGVLRSLGVEPPMKRSEKKSIKAGHDVFDYAFAKGDADFMALLEHEDPAVATAVEVRLGVKSTQKETRAARFAGIARRMDGKLPVPLDYWGAHTGRYAASESVNLQNLPRVARKDPKSGLLRRAIIAPEGKVLVVCDLSQIEARILVWQAQQHDKIEAFAQKRDVYSEQASVIYGRKVDRKKNPDDFTPGFIGKAVILGCFPCETMILSDSGWKRIVDITLEDRLWDGEEWVTHLGVVAQGEKRVARAHGLEATSDHLVMTKEGWKEWGVVNQNLSLFQSALSLASLPSSNGVGALPLREWLHGIQLFDARAERRAQLQGKTLSKVKPRDVGNVEEKSLMLHGKSIGVTQKLSLMTHIARDFLIESLQLLDAVKRGIKKLLLNTTRFVGSVFTPSGRLVLQGAGHSSSTLSLYRGGTTQSWRSTGSTITETMNRETCGSLAVVKTPRTEDTSESCTRSCMTYDIACSGPRNRFTVATDAGPIIVHNCGYGLGAPKFSSMIYVGMLGEKGILFDASYVQALEVDVGRFIAQLQRNEERMGMYFDKKPAVLSDEDWLQHCAVGTQIIKTYRVSNLKVVEYWSVANNALGAMLEGVEFEFGGPTGQLLKTVREGGTPAILKPNGALLRYEGLERDKQGNFSFLRRKEGKVQRVKTYGGALVENLTQSLARDVVMNAALLAEKRGYPMVLQVHDELVCIADETKGEEAYDTIFECMKTPPTWGHDIPLDAEGGFGKRYGDIK